VDEGCARMENVTGTAKEGVRVNRRLVIAAAIVTLLVSAPLVVMAASGGSGGRLDRQRFGFFRGVITTRSTTFHDIPGANSGLICARGAVSANVSVTASGGPFALLVRVDNGLVLHPGAVRFSGGAIDSTSYTWVGGVGPFEANDHHSFAVQWKSVTGRPVTLRKAVIDVLYRRGTAAC
jgi:hypothetical protein